jgi:hypothetical protein
MSHARLKKFTISIMSAGSTGQAIRVMKRLMKYPITQAIQRPISCSDLDDDGAR